MSYRIMNPSGPWREVLDVDADVIVDEHGEPVAIAIVVDLVAIETPGIKIEPPPDEKPAAEQARCRLTRTQASSLLEGLRRAIDEVPPPS